MTPLWHPRYHQNLNQSCRINLRCCRVTTPNGKDSHSVASWVPKEDLRVFCECVQFGHPNELSFSSPWKGVWSLPAFAMCRPSAFPDSAFRRGQKEEKRRCGSQGPGYYSRGWGGLHTVAHHPSPPLLPPHNMYPEGYFSEEPTSSHSQYKLCSDLCHPLQKLLGNKSHTGVIYNHRSHPWWGTNTTRMECFFLSRNKLYIRFFVAYTRHRPTQEIQV